MIIEVVTKDKDGNIAFNGKLNSQEVSLVLNVGINYLMANGIMPLFTGKDDEELGVVSTAPTQVQ
jgi:hypothetical protein